MNDDAKFSFFSVGLLDPLYSFVFLCFCMKMSVRVYYWPLSDVFFSQLPAGECFVSH